MLHRRRCATGSQYKETRRQTHTRPIPLPAPVITVTRPLKSSTSFEEVPILVSASL